MSALPIQLPRSAQPELHQLPFAEQRDRYAAILSQLGDAEIARLCILLDAAGPRALFQRVVSQVIHNNESVQALLAAFGIERSARRC